MITLDIKRILESDTVDSIKEAIGKLAEEIEELQDNKNTIVQEEGLQNEVDRLSDKVDDLDWGEDIKTLEGDVGNLETRIETLENKK